jgi:hypothetical protein
MNGFGAPGAPLVGAQVQTQVMQPPLERDKVIQYVQDVTNEDTREYAMLVLR